MVNRVRRATALEAAGGGVISAGAMISGAHQEPGDGPASRLASVGARIAAAEKEAGREAGSVRLIAVSKTFGPEAIRSAAAAGQADFGENRMQEAMAKWPPLVAERPDIRLHLIGPFEDHVPHDVAERISVSENRGKSSWPVMPTLAAKRSFSSRGT